MVVVNDLSENWWFPHQAFNTNTSFDSIGGIPLWNCPEPNSALGPDGKFRNPTIVFTAMVIGLIGFVAIPLIVLNYNSVRVFSKKIRTNEISNTLWIFFYLFIALRSIFDGVRYGLGILDEDTNKNSGLFLASLVCDSLTSLFLTLSLHHQLKYRSPVKLINQTQRDSNSKRESHRSRHERTEEQRSRCLPFALLSLESLYFILFVLNLVLLYLDISNFNGEKDKFYWLYLSGYVLQRVPILVLTLFVFFSYSANDGPSTWARYAVFLGSLFYLAMVAPASMLTEWIVDDSCVADCQQNCPFYFASWVDFLFWLQALAQLIYFFFLRSEYKRNMEECIWTTVTQIQDTFDFRR